MLKILYRCNLNLNFQQLRARLTKSGGEELKLFLSEKLFTVSPERRPKAADLIKLPEMVKWCCKTVEEDKKYLRKNFINEIDFSNRFKLEDGGANYDNLETVLL